MSRARAAWPKMPAWMAALMLGLMSTMSLGLPCEGHVGTVERGPVFYVATNGDDTAGDGSAGSPWATITQAVDSVPDGSLVLVRPGTYFGRQRLRRAFAQGITVRSEVPYQARLRNSDRAVTCYTGQGIALEGFDIAHDGPGAAGLVVHIQDLINGADFVRRIVLRNNVFHDSYNNDLVKINNGAGEVTVEGNIFYNQQGSDEHIDVNSVTDVIIQDNIFFNDFAGSGRPVDGSTSGFIVIKDSNAGDDAVLGSQRITVRRNIFLEWQGSTGSNFVLIGEDGQPFFEAEEVLVENNLMLGSSPEVMRSPFGVKGGRNITFRHNTVVGDLPSLAFAMRFNTEGANPNNVDIELYNNVWSDPTGSMGSTGSGSNDFSDTPPGETDTFVLDHNLYWNGPNAIPEDPAELVNYTDDVNRLVDDPRLPAASGAVVPRWDAGAGLFADGSATIGEAFRRLVNQHGTPAAGSPAIDAGLVSQAPVDDILGRPRVDGMPDLGAVEKNGLLFADGFESGDSTAWDRAVG